MGYVVPNGQFSYLDFTFEELWICICVYFPIQPMPYFHTVCRFDQCAVSDLSLKAIRDAGYEKLTMVQAATLPVILKGQ